jgi:hypothetical protein
MSADELTYREHMAAGIEASRVAGVIFTLGLLRQSIGLLRQSMINAMGEVASAGKRIAAVTRGLSGAPTEPRNRAERRRAARGKS